MVKKRKGGLLQRMLAVLLTVVLVTGMAWDAVPASVLAQESVSGNTVEPAEGETVQEEGTETVPAEGTNPDNQEIPEITEPAEGTDPTGQEPDGGTGQEPPPPDAGSGQETQEPGKEEEKEQESVGGNAAPTETVSENGAGPETVKKPQRMMRAAAPQADNIASGTDWVLDQDGKLTITSDAGMEDWIQNGLGVHRGAVKRAEIQNGVTSIGETAFTDCSNLTDIMISEDVESIGSNAFAGCKSLKSITIPDSVTNIGMYAFAGCTSLTKVTMKGGVPPTIGTNAFQGCKFVTDDTQGIYVPDVETYKNATDKGWGAWSAYIIEDSAPAEGHEHDGVTFTAWTKTDSLPTGAGNYYLTENVTLTDKWVPNGAISLCLNGKTISISWEETVIGIQGGNTLILYDCENTGNITGGSYGVNIEHSGTFQMYGGKISGNSDWGVSIFGIFEMSGGEISGNSGGVFIASGRFIVGGQAVISGNTADGKADNGYLRDGQTIELDSSNPLTGSASIGVTTETAPTEGNPVDITGHNKEDYGQYFHSDNPAYEIVNVNNVVQLAVKSQSHTHDYGETWKSDETNHWHECTECGDKKDSAAHTEDDGTVTVKPTETTTGTKEYKCTVCERVLRTETLDKLSPSHTHTYGEAWKSDETNHWHECTECGDKKDSAAHTEDDGTVTVQPTQTTTGTKVYGCSECGREMRTETIPATGGSQGGGNQGGGNQGGSGGNSGSGGNGGSSGSNGGNNSGAGDNSGSGNSGGAGGNNVGGSSSGGNPGNSGSGAGTTALGSDASGARQPRVKQEKEGNIRKEVSVTGESMLDAAIETPLSKLADIVLTKEEKQQAAAGTDIKIVLDVKDATASVRAADKKAVETALGGSLAKGYTLGQYLDISLYKIIGNSRSIVTNTNGKITVTIDVPDSLKNTDSTKTRTFAVIRVHDGRAEILTDLDNEEDTITIETDRFSTYALVYKDAAGANAIRVSVENDSSPNSGNKKTGGRKDDEPATGDRTPIELGATLSMIAGFTYLFLYFADRKRGMTEETKKELVSQLIRWGKQGGKIRKYLALAVVFVLLVYYHSIGKRTCVKWKEIYGE